MPVRYKAYTPSPKWDFKQRLNPCWWFQDETMPAGLSLAEIWLWERRNYLQNFFAFVIGVQDRDHQYWATSNPEGIFTKGNGVQVGFVWTKSCVPMPLFSFKLLGWEGYVGWRPIGAFGLTLRVANAKSWGERD